MSLGEVREEIFRADCFLKVLGSREPRGGAREPRRGSESGRSLAGEPGLRSETSQRAQERVGAIFRGPRDSGPLRKLGSVGKKVSEDSRT